MSNDLKDIVLAIVYNIENPEELGLNEDGEQMSAMDYIFDALDIEYTISSTGDYLGARILVTFGGPNIWISTRTDQVKGYWWADKLVMAYEDNLGLDEACEELFNMQ